MPESHWRSETQLWGWGSGKLKMSLWGNVEGLLCRGKSVYVRSGNSERSSVRSWRCRKPAMTAALKTRGWGWRCRTRHDGNWAAGVGAGARSGWGLSCAVYMHVSKNLFASLACVQASMLKIISTSLAHLLHASVIKHIPMGPSWDTPHP